MVGLVGTLFFYSQSVIALEPPALGTYVPVVFAYAVLVVLSCTSQDLYRTPRDRGVLEETLMVLKAVSLATAVLVVVVFLFGARGHFCNSAVPLGVLSGVTRSRCVVPKPRSI